MAPSHALRVHINEIVRERLIRDGQVKGPGIRNRTGWFAGATPTPRKQWQRTTPPGDVVAFHRPYKRLGVEKGDDLRVEGIDRDAGTVNLRAKGRGHCRLDPAQARRKNRRGGSVPDRKYGASRRRPHPLDPQNDNELGLINSQTAEVARVKNGTVTFALEDGRTLDLKDGAPQLRHIDRAWASTVHAFQGRTVDTVIAAMEANHPHLTTQKTLYVEISRARDRAELVTDDRDALRERLEAVTGERISALEAVEPVQGKVVEPALETAHDQGWEKVGPEAWEQSYEPEKVHEPREIEMEM